MRFMVMHKMTDELEAGGPPDREIIDGVDGLIAEGLEKKVFVSGEGLKPTKERTYLEYQGGKRSYAILDLPSKEAAIEWAVRFGHIVRVNEVEVRQLPEWA